MQCSAFWYINFGNVHAINVHECFFFFCPVSNLWREKKKKMAYKYFGTSLPCCSIGKKLTRVQLKIHVSGCALICVMNLSWQNFCCCWAHIIQTWTKSPQKMHILFKIRIKGIWTLPSWNILLMWQMTPVVSLLGN